MFLLLFASLVAGIVAGLAARGRIGALRAMQVRWTPMLFVALIVGMAPLYVDMPKGLRQTIQMVTMLAVLIFLAANIIRSRGGVRAGWVALLAGWALNFIVIAANGGMPLSAWAFARSGQTGLPTPGESGFFKIELATPDTILRPLGDVIPIKPVFAQVVSIGDLVLMAGIAVVIAAGMRARQNQPTA